MDVDFLWPGAEEFGCAGGAEGDGHGFGAADGGYDLVLDEADECLGLLFGEHGFN